MPKLSFCFLLGVVILLNIIQEGASRKCYHCSSPTGGICGNLTRVDTKNIRTVNCAKTENFCGTVEVKDRWFSNITRDCFSTQNCNGINTFGGTCHTCNADLCNSSAGVLPSFLAGIFALGFIKFYNFLMMGI